MEREHWSKNDQFEKDDKNTLKCVKFYYVDRDSKLIGIGNWQAAASDRDNFKCKLKGVMDHNWSVLANEASKWVKFYARI